MERMFPAGCQIKLYGENKKGGGMALVLIKAGEDYGAISTPGYFYFFFFSIL